MMKGRRLLKDYSPQDMDKRIFRLVPRLTSKLSVCVCMCFASDIMSALDMFPHPEQYSAYDVYYTPEFEAECQKWHTLQDKDDKEEYLDEWMVRVRRRRKSREARSILGLHSLMRHSLRGRWWSGEKTGRVDDKRKQMKGTGRTGWCYRSVCKRFR